MHLYRAISQAELMIVAGTSLQVRPAASLIQLFGGDCLVVINPDKQVIHFNGQVINFQEGTSQVFSKVKEYL